MYTTMKKVSSILHVITNQDHTRIRPVIYIIVQTFIDPDTRIIPHREKMKFELVVGNTSRFFSSFVLHDVKTK